MTLLVQGKMITVLFLYRPLAWCFLRGMKYIIPLIIFLVLVIPSEYLGFSSLIAFGLWMMGWSYRIATLLSTATQRRVSTEARDKRVRCEIRGILYKDKKSPHVLGQNDYSRGTTRTGLGNFRLKGQ